MALELEEQRPKCNSRSLFEQRKSKLMDMATAVRQAEALTRTIVMDEEKAKWEEIVEQVKQSDAELGERIVGGRARSEKDAQQASASASTDKADALEQLRAEAEQEEAAAIAQACLEAEQRVTSLAEAKSDLLEEGRRKGADDANASAKWQQQTRCRRRCSRLSKLQPSVRQQRRKLPPIKLTQRLCRRRRQALSPSSRNEGTSRRCARIGTRMGGQLCCV